MKILSSKNLLFFFITCIQLFGRAAQPQTFNNYFFDEHMQKQLDPLAEQSEWLKQVCFNFHAAWNGVLRKYRAGKADAAYQNKAKDCPQSLKIVLPGSNKTQEVAIRSLTPDWFREKFESFEALQREKGPAISSNEDIWFRMQLCAGIGLVGAGLSLGAWQTALTVASYTSATGLMGGVVAGLVLVSVPVRKGYSRLSNAYFGDAITTCAEQYAKLDNILRANRFRYFVGEVFHAIYLAEDGEFIDMNKDLRLQREVLQKKRELRAKEERSYTAALEHFVKISEQSPSFKQLVDKTERILKEKNADKVHKPNTCKKTLKPVETTSIAQAAISISVMPQLGKPPSSVNQRTPKQRSNESLDKDCMKCELMKILSRSLKADPKKASQ